MLLTAFIIVALIAPNALYVAAEFAAVSVRTSRVQQQAEQGKRLARRLIPFLRDAHALDRYIAACQVGITLSSLMLGAFGQIRVSAALTPLLERFGALQTATAEVAAAAIVLAGLTALQVVFGELVPKSLALQYPTRIALWTVIPMQWSLRAMSWFIVVLNGSGTLVLKLIGFEQSGHRHIHSPDELELLIAESREGGMLKPSEHQRLRNALRLGLRKVSQVMVPRVRVEALNVDLPFDSALATISASPHTRLPVYQDTIDNIIGFVHARDVARSVGLDTQRSVRALMRHILVIPATLTLDRFLVRLREERQQFAIVLDEFGGTAGLASVQDVLDELFGEVADEFKTADPHPERLPDGRIRVPGSVAVDTLDAFAGIEWPAGAAQTVGGRVVEAFHRIPSAGERTTIDGVGVEVEAVAHHAVTSVLITLPPKHSGASD